MKFFPSAIFAVSALSASQQAAAEPKPIDLGTLGGAASVAYDINDQEQVVGNSTATDGKVHAFLWEKGLMRDLGLGEARSINNQGDVVGFRLDHFDASGFQINGIVYAKGEVKVLPPLPGQTQTAAYAINDGGQIVGLSDHSAVIWNDSVPTDLGSLGGGDTAAMAINNKGWVVGFSKTSTGDYHGFLWHDGVMQDIGTLGGMTVAHAINEQGQIVGESGGKGFIWENGVMTELKGNGSSAYAYDINASGLIAGKGDHWARTYPTLWSNDLAVEELALLPGALWADSAAVNKQGAVVGSTTFGVPSDHVAPTGAHATLWK